MSRGQEKRLAMIATTLTAKPKPQEFDMNLEKLRAEADAEFHEKVQAAIRERDDFSAVERYFAKMAVKANGHSQLMPQKQETLTVEPFLSNTTEVPPKRPYKKSKRGQIHSRKSDYGAIERVVLSCIQSKPVRPWTAKELVDRVRHLMHTTKPGSQSQAVRATGQALVRKNLAIAERDNLGNMTYSVVAGLEPARSVNDETTLAISKNATGTDRVAAALMDLREANPSEIAEWLISRGLNPNNYKQEKMTQSVRWALQDLREDRRVKSRKDPHSQHTLYSLRGSTDKPDSPDGAAPRQDVKPPARPYLLENVTAALLELKEASPSEIARWLIANNMNPSNLTEKVLGHGVAQTLKRLTKSHQAKGRHDPRPVGLGQHKRMAYSLVRPSINVTKEAKEE